MKMLIFICVIFYCCATLAGISRQEAQNFAVRCTKILCSDGGSNSLRSFISDKGGRAVGMVGWSENYWFSETINRPDFVLGKLDIDRVLIREPDVQNPMQIQLTDYETAKCVTSPEKIAVVYLSNVQKDVRAVLVMPLISANGKTMLCPMAVKNTVDEPTQFDVAKRDEIPTGNNLSHIHGVEITKIADDDNSFGFPLEKEARVFDTNPSGCTLRQTVLYDVDQSVWVNGLDCLPQGRFRIHCQLLAGEGGTVGDKLLNAIASTFKLDVKMEAAYLWDGYQVVHPVPLPDCFDLVTNLSSQSVMHGIGDYEGYSLNKIISNALHKKPFEMNGAYAANRYNVRLTVWPEAYGERAALEQLGFKITPVKMPKQTLIISCHNQNLNN